MPSEKQEHKNDTHMTRLFQTYAVTKQYDIQTTIRSRTSEKTIK